MPRGAEARAWWADVEDVKERIEDRRAFERLDERSLDERRERRTVSITGNPPSQVVGATRLSLVRSAPAEAEAQRRGPARRRPRPRVAERMGARPDRVAGLAVMLGFLLVLAAMLSAHG